MTNDKILPTTTYKGRHPNYMLLNTNKKIRLSSDEGLTGGKIAGGLISFGGKLITAGLGMSGLNSYVNTAAADAGQEQSIYAVAPFENLNSRPFGTPVPYPDFRTRRFTLKGDQTFGEKLKKTPNLFSSRVDGLSASLRGSVKGATMAAQAATVGIYNLYNVDNYYGLGTQGAPALRNDFTVKTMAGRSSTFKRLTGMQKVRSIVNRVNTFRGDKVNVIDASRRNHHNIYRWKPQPVAGESKFAQKMLGAADKLKTATRFLGANPHGQTNDFIKFFFTGPNAHIGDKDAIDDVIVFRSTLTSFSDTFSPSWAPVSILGRADTNFHYSGYARSVDLGFTVYATSRDEVKFIFRKLNALAGYTAPEYKNNSISLVAPWLRVTVGDLFVSTPAIINSLSYTMVDSDTTWEINLEQDPEMKQTPHKITVSMGLDIITNELPEKGGAFYSLGDKNTYDKHMRRKTGIQPDGTVIEASTERDWLSDVKNSVPKTKKTAIIDPGANQAIRDEQGNQ
jgi:hypothetical protein